MPSDRTLKCTLISACIFSSRTCSADAADSCVHTYIMHTPVCWKLIYPSVRYFVCIIGSSCLLLPVSLGSFTCVTLDYHKAACAMGSADCVFRAYAGSLQTTCQATHSLKLCRSTHVGHCIAPPCSITHICADNVPCLLQTAVLKCSYCLFMSSMRYCCSSSCSQCTRGLQQQQQEHMKICVYANWCLLAWHQMDPLPL